MRIVSLLPSATEVLCAIGGAGDLVGRSHECDHPPGLTDVPTLTRQRINPGTSAQIDAQVREHADQGAASLYHLDDALLRDLKPDLILTQDLCEVCSIDLETVRRIAADMDPSPRVLSLDPHDIFEVFDDILEVGRATDRLQEAEAAMVSLREGYWTAIDHVNPYVPGPEILFMEWIDPVFVAGHWTPGLIEQAGGRHSLNTPGSRSRQVDAGEIIASQPQRIIVCPCGLPLGRIEEELDHLRAAEWWHAVPAVSDGEASALVMVDGNQMFNRPGPRLVDAFRWLVGWINDRPELIPEDFPARPFGPDPAARPA